MSQLDVSLEAEISSRHLSYLESGKAQPSREMLTRLSDALAIPLRERNALLMAAGYAPVYRESTLSTPEMALARRAVDFILKQQEPYPAIVLDRHWDLVLINNGAARLIQFLLGTEPREHNVVRQIFSNDLLRPYIANWDEVAADMIRRLHQEIDWGPDGHGIARPFGRSALVSWRAGTIAYPRTGSADVAITYLYLSQKQHRTPLFLHLDDLWRSPRRYSRGIEDRVVLPS